jgi:tripeptidyl-peptidase-1
MVPPNSSVYEPGMACEELIYSGGQQLLCYARVPETAVDDYLTNYYPNYPADIWNSTGQAHSFFTSSRKN